MVTQISMREGTLILQKLENIEQKVGTIEQKLGQHDQRFENIEKKLEQHDQRFDKIEQKLEGQSLTLGRMAGVLGDHQEQLTFIIEFLGERVVTHEEYFTGQDQVMKILKRLDDERPVTHERLRKLELHGFGV